MKTIATALFCCLVASFSHANSVCDQPRDDFDGLYCLNKVYQQADTDLNQVYKKLASKLDADGKKSLKRGQLAWIEARNENCSMKKGNSFYVNLSCATDTTISRTKFLQDRQRECVSAGCMNSKLSGE